MDREPPAAAPATGDPPGPPSGDTTGPATGAKPGAPKTPASGATVVIVIAVVIAIAGVQLLLPPSVTIGPLWLLPAIELLGIPLGIAIWVWPRQDWEWLTDRLMRLSMTVYLGFLGLATALNAVLLLTSLLSGSDDSGAELLLAGFGVLLINVLTFGLIYWWLDGGGPKVRASGAVARWDFQFPQQAAGQEWTPVIIDYLYTAYTNIIAFSPTDTMPLTPRVKILFTVQSAISLVTILVTLSRAVNLIPAG